MTSERTRVIAAEIAARIRESAAQIVEDWISDMFQQTAGRTRVLPRRAVRDHIPGALRAMADYVESPSDEARSALLTSLELHGRFRRDQGYDLRQLLDEFEGLSFRISGTALGWLLEMEPRPDLIDARPVLERIERSCRSIAIATVGIYRESEMVHRQELSRQLEDFARAVSHELKNPLNAARLQASLLRRALAEDEAVLRRVSTIESSIDRANELVDNIRVLALAASSSAQGRHVDLHAVIHGVIDELTTAAQRRRVEVHVADPLPPVSVEVVSTQLALVNVLSNAIKYCDPDKKQRTATVSAQLEHDDDEDGVSRLQISVSDNGLGIPKEFQSHVFRRHFRAHPDRAEGTGLGLAITRHVLLENGGEIHLDSAVGQGTTIRIEIPAIHATIDPRETHPTSLRPLTEQSLRRRRDREMDLEAPTSE